MKPNLEFAARMLCNIVQTHMSKPSFYGEDETGLVPAVLGSYLSMYCLPSDREFSLVAQPGQPSSTNTEKQAQLSSWTLFPWVSLAQSHCASLRNSFVTGHDWHLTEQ